MRRFIVPTFLTGAIFSLACIATMSTPLRQSKTPIRIMPIGDSITQADGNHNSYRRQLWFKLRKAGYNVDFVGSTREHFEGTAPLTDFDQDHEGHWGWRTDDVLAQMDEWVRLNRPDVALIHLGTNDIFSKHSMQSTIAELRELILTLRKSNPRVKVLLAELIPCGDPAKIQQLNRRIVYLARETNTIDSPVRVVDQFTGFNAKEGFDTYDGCHPNESGEKKMAERWFEGLKQVLPSP